MNMILDFMKKHSKAFSMYHWGAFLFTLIAWRFQWQVFAMTGIGLVFSCLEFLIDKYGTKDNRYPAKSEFTLLMIEVVIFLACLSGLVTPKSWIILNCIFVPLNETSIFCTKKYDIRGVLFKNTED